MRPDVLIEALSISAEKAYRWVSHLSLAMRLYEINNTKRQAAFLSRVWHESEHLERTSVELRGISPRRIQAMWPTLFHTVEEARPFSGLGHGLANQVFANCNGNGDYASGDGFRFRPRGLIPLCGRRAYERASLALEFDFIGQPDRMAEDHWAALSAGWFWQDESLNELADKEEIDAITNILDRRHLTDGRPNLHEIHVAYREMLQVLK